MIFIICPYLCSHLTVSLRDNSTHGLDLIFSVVFYEVPIILFFGSGPVLPSGWNFPGHWTCVLWFCGRLLILWATSCVIHSFTSTTVPVVSKRDVGHIMHPTSQELCILSHFYSSKSKLEYLWLQGWLDWEITYLISQEGLSLRTLFQNP